LLAFACFLQWDITDYPNRVYMSEMIARGWSATAGALPASTTARFPLLGDGAIGVYAPIGFAIMGFLMLVVGWSILGDTDKDDEDEPEEPAREPIPEDDNVRHMGEGHRDRAA
jgi:TRAP-type C4-dicarboxylate transport system permease small subunit